jgi:hypothetical protein
MRRCAVCGASLEGRVLADADLFASLPARGVPNPGRAGRQEHRTVCDPAHAVETVQSTPSVALHVRQAGSRGSLAPTELPGVHQKSKNVGKTVLRGGVECSTSVQYVPMGVLERRYAA